MRKRLLSILLTACMVWSLLPASAWAAGPAAAPGGVIEDAESAKTAFGEGNITIDGTIITLNTDIEAKISLQFSHYTGSEDEWTLNLNGHSVVVEPDISGSRGRTIAVGDSVTLTLQGSGEIVGQSSTYDPNGTGSGGWGGNGIDVFGTLILDGAMKISGGGSLYNIGGAGVYVESSGTLRLTADAAPTIVAGMGSGGDNYDGEGIMLTPNATMEMAEGAAPEVSGGCALYCGPGAAITGGLTGGTYTIFDGGDASVMVSSQGSATLSGLLAEGYSFYKVSDNSKVTLNDETSLAYSVYVDSSGGGSGGGEDPGTGPTTSPGGEIGAGTSAGQIAALMEGCEAEDSTLRLTKNVTLTDKITFTGGEWTLDLNGHTITGPDGRSALAVGAGAKLTLTSTEGGGVLGGETSGMATVDVSGTLTLEGSVALTGGGGGGGAGGNGVYAHGSGALILGEGAKPTLTGGRGSPDGVGLQCDYGTTLTIGDGAAPVCTGSSGLQLNANATVEGHFTGGTFTPASGGSGSAIYNPGNKSLLAPGYGFFAVEDDTWVNGGGSVTLAVTVKPLGGSVKSDTGSAAVVNIFGGKAEKDGSAQKITLTDDVTLGQEVMFSGGDWTLDLNGYTLSLAEGLPVSHAVKCVGGTLTITDSQDGGMIVGGEAGAVFSTGTGLTITGGAFKGEPALHTLGAPILTGGVFESASGPAIVSDSELVPLPAFLGAGCRFVDQNGDPVDDGDLAGAAYLAVKGPATGTGGTISGSSTAETIRTAFGSGATVSDDGLTVTLNDDIRLEAGIVFTGGSGGAALTLDLNGHTLLSADVTLTCNMGELVLKGPGGVTGGPGSSAVMVMEPGDSTVLTLEGKLTLTGGGKSDGAGGSGLKINDSLGGTVKLGDDLDLTCIGGSGSTVGGPGVEALSYATVEGTLSKGRFEGGMGVSAQTVAFSGSGSFPLAAGVGYFAPGEDREYFFGLGDDVPPVLEVRAFDKNIRVDYEDPEGTTVSRYFSSLEDMNTYFDYGYGGKVINLLANLSGRMSGNVDGESGGVTIDGQGHTLSRQPGECERMVFVSGSSGASIATVKNIVLDGTYPYLSYDEDGTTIKAALELESTGPEGLLENVTIQNNGVIAQPPAEPAAEPAEAALQNGEKMTVRSSRILNNVGAVGGISGDDAVVIEDSEISGNTGLMVGGIANEIGEVTLSGTTVSGNTGLMVGGLYASSGYDPSFTLSGPEGHPTVITGNRAAMPQFPAYYLLDQEEMELFPNMAGGVLANTLPVYLSGNVTIKDNYVGQGTGTPSNLVLAESPVDGYDYEYGVPPEVMIVVTGPLTGGAGSIGVSRVLMTEDGQILPVTGVVARGTTAEENGGEAYTLTQTDLAAFFSDSPDYVLVLEGNQILLTAKGVAEVGGRYYNSLPEALAAAPDGQPVRLLQNTVLQEALVIDKKVTLDLNGCTLTGAAGNNAIEVVTGGVLTLHDDTGTGEVIGGTGGHLGVEVQAGGKLILSGKVRVTGGANESGDGGDGMNCGGALALSPGAEPTLTGGSGSGIGGIGLFLDTASAVDGLITGGVYTGGEGGDGNVGNGLTVMWVDADIRPLLSGGRYEGINMGGVASKNLPALLPDYCYYADEYGTKLDPQPSSTYTTDTVTVARRGGPVHDIYEFQAALGGAENARINSQTNTVTLDDDVDLVAPVEIAAGTYTLDLYGYSITGAAGEAVENYNYNAMTGRPALLLNGAGVELTVMDSDFNEEYPSAVTGGAGGSYKQSGATKNADGGAGIQVKAGALTVTGDAHVTGGESTGENGEGGLGGYGVQVTGGSLTLTGTPVITGGEGKETGGDGIYVDMAGTLRVLQGASPTVTGGDSSSGSSRGYGVKLSGTAQIAGGSYYGKSGIIIANSSSAALTVTGGSFTGSSDHGGHFSSGQRLEISGGTFQGAEGQAALWISPLQNGAYKGILSGGSLLGGKAIDLYKPQGGTTDSTAVPADLLAEGFRFYDRSGDVVEDLSGTQDGNNLILSGPVTVGRARWTEFADTAWYDGQKAEFTLTTAAQLAGLAKLVNGGNNFNNKTVKLGADIDLGAHDWVPIAGTSGIFSGEFDGQGHAITGMKVTGDWEYAGLFGVVGRGTIHDLALSGNVSAARTSGTACVGGLAGSVFGGPSEVYNVLFTGTVSLAGLDGMVGGLVGEMEVSDTALSNCAALAEVSVGPVGSPAGVRSSFLVYAGGLVGGMSGYDGDPKVDLRNCYAAGTVTVQPGAGPVRTAALVGDASEATEVTGPLYYLDTMGAPSGYGTFDNAPTAMTADEMRASAFADTLNAWVTAQDEGTDYATWYAHAGAYPDFTKSGGGGNTGGSGGSGDSGGSTTTSKTETNPDGSKTTTVTDKKTGTVTETTKAENGVETVVKTEKDGTVTAAVTVPQTALTPPKEGGVPLVEIPGQPLPTGESGTGEGSTAIAVDLPGALDTPVIVAIPVTDGTVVLRADGTPVALSLVEDGKAYVVLETSEELRIVTAGDFFDDVEGAAKAAADFGAARALWTGTGEREFSPEMIMNRAMLATVLWRLDGAEDKGSVELFPDVPEDAWFASAVAWGGETGVVQGTGEGFAPDVALTAEQMLVMLYRYTTYADLLVPAAEDTGAGAPEGTSSWAAEAVAWAINAGLVRLGEDGDLTAPITRAQAAEIMRGYVGYLVRR